MSRKWSNEEIQFLIENYPLTSARDLALMLNRDYSSTKRAIKRYILDAQDGILPEGFVVIKQSPIHAINANGEVIRIRTRKQIKPSPNRKGYLQVCLQGKKSYRVHRLVAENFVPNLENKPQVNHKDGNKLNNHWSNLEWVTNAENQSHAIKNGLWDNISSKISMRQTGSGNSRAKLTEKDVMSIYDKLRQGMSVTAIAKMFGVNHANICAIKSGKSWKHLYSYYSEGSTTRA